MGKLIIYESIIYSIKYSDIIGIRESLNLSQEQFGQLLGWSQQNQADIEKRALSIPSFQHELTHQQVNALKKAGCKIKFKKYPKFYK